MLYLYFHWFDKDRELVLKGLPWYTPHLWQFHSCCVLWTLVLSKYLIFVCGRGTGTFGQATLHPSVVHTPYQHKNPLEPFIKTLISLSSLNYRSLQAILLFGWPHTHTHTLLNHVFTQRKSAILLFSVPSWVHAQSSQSEQALLRPSGSECRGVGSHSYFVEGRIVHYMFETTLILMFAPASLWSPSLCSPLKHFVTRCTSALTSAPSRRPCLISCIIGVLMQCKWMCRWIDCRWFCVHDVLLLS